MTDVPYGYCQCGCGEKAPLYKTTVRKRGIVKGQPARYRVGHYGKSIAKQPPADMPDRRLCGCGCGQETPLATYTHWEVGVYKGKPLRFINGHNPRKADRYREEDRGHDTPCWVWLLGRDKDGYGKVRFETRDMRAHRHMYEQAHGPIPVGLELDHLCRVPECVNPAHLEPVTPAENVRRSSRAKINSAIAADIRRRVASGERRVVVGAEYGLTRSAVGAVVTGKHWA